MSISIRQPLTPLKDFTYPITIANVLSSGAAWSISFAHDIRVLVSQPLGASLILGSLWCTHQYYVPATLVVRPLTHIIRPSNDVSSRVVLSLDIECHIGKGSQWGHGVVKEKGVRRWESSESFLQTVSYSFGISLKPGIINEITAI